MIVITAAVEGIVDEAVVRRLLAHARLISGDVHGKNGKPHLYQRLLGYNRAAHYAPWIMLVDLDNDANCAPHLRRKWVLEPAPYMCFRIAVRAVESWLLADGERVASFLGVPRRRIPADPESLADPKETVVSLAQQSRRREVREDMAPRPGSGRSVGPAYASRLIEFVSASPRPWRPDVASLHSESLRRAMDCLKQLAQTWSTGRSP